MRNASTLNITRTLLALGRNRRVLPGGGGRGEISRRNVGGKDGGSCLADGEPSV